MVRTKALSFAMIAAGALATAASRSAWAESADSVERRWSVGVQFGVLDRPSGHLGIPVAGSEDGYHLPFGLLGRYQISARLAINAGIGLPTGAMGAGVWTGIEVLQPIVADPRRVVALEVYEDSGLALGFAGPDYFARRDNDFVGYGYAYGGPIAFAVRLPVGLRACWLRNRFDTFVEGAEVLALTPSVESLFELAAGLRVHW